MLVLERMIDQETREKYLVDRRNLRNRPSANTDYSRRQKKLKGDLKGAVDFGGLEMNDYDVILEMDWLSTHHAIIDCQKKVVRFQRPGAEKFKFKGSARGSSIPLISALKANELLRNGCHGYLASVVDTTKEISVQPADLLVVRDFLDVFPEDLPGMPPDREIDFNIELAPGTAPISKAPYRMAPAELKELKTQLQELIDKGFIRPSHSP